MADAECGDSDRSGVHDGGDSERSAAYSGCGRDGGGDCHECVQLCHSLVGDTDCLVATLLIWKVCEEYLDRIKETIFIMTSSTVSDTVAELHNAVLSFHQIAENVDDCMCLDNESLCGIFSTLKLTTPTYEDLKHLVSASIGGVQSFMKDDVDVVTVRWHDVP